MVISTTGITARQDERKRLLEGVQVSVDGRRLKIGFLPIGTGC
jgi:hypothetical protein